MASVPPSTRKLDELAALLERTGGDPERIEAVRRAQGFRRSWVDLAEALCRIRRSGGWQSWGFDNFYDYCQSELTLKRPTVDKLTISFTTLQRHAPTVLKHDGIAKSIPSYEAVNYFQRAMDDDDAANDAGVTRRSAKPRPASEELSEEFHRAVFDEGQPVTELRKRFDDKFFPKPTGQGQLDTLRKASSMARKLAELLPDIDGIPPKQVRTLEVELGKLRAAIDDLAEPIKDKVARSKARANKSVARADAELERDRKKRRKKSKSTRAG